MRNLSGWARIYIVIAIVWTVAMTIANAMKQTDQYESDRYYYTKDALIGVAEQLYNENSNSKNEPSYRYLKLLSLNEQSTAYSTKFQMTSFANKAMDSELSRKQTINAIENAYQRGIDEVNGKPLYYVWRNFAIGVLGSSLIPLIALLMVFKTIVWIRNGFR